MGQHGECPFIHPFTESPCFHGGFKLLFCLTENRDIADSQNKQFNQLIGQGITLHGTRQIDICHVCQQRRDKQQNRIHFQRDLQGEKHPCRRLHNTLTLNFPWQCQPDKQDKNIQFQHGQQRTAQLTAAADNKQHKSTRQTGNKPIGLPDTTEQKSPENRKKQAPVRRQPFIHKYAARAD